MDRRLGRGAFFGVWILLFGGQLAALANQASTPDGPGLPLQAVVAIVVVLQLLKLPFTAWRLNDIGRPASDAVFFVLIPVANIIGLMRFMVEAQPSAKGWEQRRRGWANQMGPLQAVAHALPLVARTASVGVPVVLVYGIVMAGVGQWVLDFAEDAATMDPASRATLAQIFTVASVFLGLYTVVQFMKRTKATRLSWFPSLFLMPSVLLAASLSFFSAGMQANLQLILLTFIYMAWQMVWMTLGGAALVVATTLAAERVRTGQPLDAGSIFAQLGPRTLDVAGPHGTRVQAVTVGMQVIIPGIFYMLQLAFADSIAVLKPEAAALKESGQLTWGMRQRLFKLFLAMTVFTMLLHFALVSGIDGVDKAMAYFIDPRNMSFGSFAAGEMLWGVYAWVLQIALLLMYHDRVRYLEDRRAERRAQKAEAGEGPAVAPADPDAAEIPAPAPRTDDDWKRIAESLDALDGDARQERIHAQLEDAGLQVTAAQGDLHAALALADELAGLRSQATRHQDPGKNATIQEQIESHVLDATGYLHEAIPAVDQARYLLHGEPGLDYAAALAAPGWKRSLEGAVLVHRLLAAELESLRSAANG
ncbi:MAG: hypothetical protein R3F61_13230 [Myxococcota bacterium]